MASSKQKQRGAQASRSSFRAKPKKQAVAKRAVAKPRTKANAASKAKATAAKTTKTTKTTKTKPTPRRTAAHNGATDTAPAGNGAAVEAQPRRALGEITVPSGTLAIFDIGLFGYLPREALDPAIVTAKVPADRALAVVAAPVGKGRFAACWDHVAIVLGEGEVVASKKLGDAGVDFARLVLIDHAALDHWVHEDSLDGRADFVFWGRDAPMLAQSMNAKRLAEGYGWTDLALADAERKGDEAARRKAANSWLLATDLRPHSHHFQALAAARADPHGAGALELAGSRLLVFFTSWGDGVFPIYLDRNSDDQPVQIRIQLATAESNAAMTAVNR